MKPNQPKNVTEVGTDIEEVKRKNANSGLSYNEAKALIARETGGYGTAKYSNTDPEEVRREIAGDLNDTKEF
ncbi:MAG TPA: gamma-type small acid-soluble spore protein [Candidatus Angelobacter sp.]|nr:gamma-type small acid-soluble spore protein [Candidatus Angelobacter sp.]